MQLITVSASSAPVTSATIFQSSTAEVTRKLSLELNSGRNVVKIVGISRDSDSESPRISGAPDGVRVLDVVCQRKRPGAPDLRDDATAAEIETHVASVRALEAQRDIRQQEFNLLDQWARSTAAGSRATGNTPNWHTEILGFMDGFVQRQLEAQKAVQALDAQITALEKKLWVLRGERQGEATTTITAVVVAKNDGKVDLNLTYLVSGVSWQPFYDLHATTADGQPSANVTLHYCATISQSTGEDWSDTTLILSTANSQTQSRLSVPVVSPLGMEVGRPNSNGVSLPDGVNIATGPGLQPTVVQPAPLMQMQMHMQQQTQTQAHQPVQELPAVRRAISHVSSGEPQGVSRSLATPARIKRAVSSTIPTQGVSAPPAPPAPPPPPPPVPSRNALSLSYRVDGAVSLPSDGESHKLTVAVLDFKAALKYVCAPQKSQAAFIVGTVKNTSEYELLPGPVSVFMDDSFVTKTAVQFIAINESFPCTLGIDTSLKVAYKQCSKTEHEPRRNFAEPHKTITRTATTTIANQHAHAVTQLVVRDAVPLANEDAQISVALRKPAGLAEASQGDEVAVKLGDGEDSATAKARWTKVKDGQGGEKYGLYEWACTIPAGKKITLAAQWDVKGPSGLEWNEVPQLDRLLD